MRCEDAVASVADPTALVGQQVNSRDVLERVASFERQLDHVLETQLGQGQILPREITMAGASLRERIEECAIADVVERRHTQLVRHFNEHVFRLRSAGQVLGLRLDERFNHLANDNKELRQMFYDATEEETIREGSADSDERIVVGNDLRQIRSRLASLEEALVQATARGPASRLLRQCSAAASR